MKDKYWVDYMGNDLKRTQELIDNWKEINKKDLVDKRHVLIDQLIYEI